MRKRVAEVLNKKPFLSEKDEADEDMLKSLEDAVKKLRLNSIEKDMEAAVDTGDAELLQRLLGLKNQIENNGVL